VRGYLDPPGFNCARTNAAFLRYMDELLCRIRGEESSTLSGRFYNPTPRGINGGITVFPANNLSPPFELECR
jgi:hypothetical protein